jgi:hypothetical protein
MHERTNLAERGTRPKTRLPTPPEDQVPVDPQLWSVDLLASKVVSSRVEEEEARLLKGLLGLDTDVAMPPFASQQEAAERLEVKRVDVQQTLEAARERWTRQPWMTSLRDDIARLIDKHSGAMTGDELAEAVLSARGSVADGDERRRLASAVAYAAIETEAARESARFTLYRQDEGLLAVATQSLSEQYRAPVQWRAQYVQRLARRCDDLAEADPLLAPIRVTQELLSVPAPEGDRPVPLGRLVRLGVRASARAALSSRMEIYPRGMQASGVA